MSNTEIMPYNSMRLVYEAAQLSCVFSGRCCYCKFEEFCSSLVKAYKAIPEQALYEIRKRMFENG